MTVQEAGRRGGNKVMAERGRQYYQEIGHKGGIAVSTARGSQYYREIGKLGGAAVKAKLGLGHYRRMAQLGGAKTRQKGPEYFSAIGRKGGGAHGRNAHLTKSKVRELRGMWATGQWLQRDLAVRFGIKQPTVSQIVTWKTWRWLDEELTPETTVQ